MESGNVMRGFARVTMGTSAVLLAGLLLSGCFSDTVTPFPEGLEPWEELTLLPPEGTPGNEYPEQLAVSSTKRPDYHSVQGAAYLPFDLESVYAAMREPEVTVDHARVDRYTIVSDVEPQYDHSHVIHNEVDDIITVDFDVNWRFGTEQLGDETQRAAGRWQKTRGTQFITTLRGSVIATPIERNVTMIQVLMQLDAAAEGDGPAKAFVHDYHNNIRATLRGEPIRR